MLHSRCYTPAQRCVMFLRVYRDTRYTTRCLHIQGHHLTAIDKFPSVPIVLEQWSTGLHITTFLPGMYNFFWGGG